MDLFECTVFKYHDEPSTCAYYIANFEQCRKTRDIKILDGIKEWESSHIRSLDQQNRQFYMQGLTFKLNRLKEDYSKIPSTSGKHLKMVQVES